jgi:peptidoglycan/LPS O-acetylase OafA/YrhL
MKRSDALDGLRGVAILLVVAGHCWLAYGNNNPTMAWLAPCLFNATLGVRLFFVLSGYLITALLVAERRSTGSISLPKFYARRALRIFPAFYVFFGCVLFLAAAGFLTVPKAQLLAAATYTYNYLAVWPGYSGAAQNWFLGHLWTLSLEEQFYLFWPATLLLLGNARSLKAAVAIVVLTPAIRIGSYYLFPGLRGFLDMMLHTAVDSIMAGCVLALVSRDSLPPSVATCVKWKGTLPATLIFLLFVSPLLVHRFKGIYLATVGYTLDAVGAAVIICHVSVLGPGMSPARVLSLPPLVFIGRLSYGWYLWQQLFLTRLNHTWSGSFPASIVCSFGVALGSHYLIERPFLRLKKKFQPPLAQPGWPRPMAEPAR